MARRNNPRSFDKTIHIYRRTVGDTKFEFPIKLHFDGKVTKYVAEANAFIGQGIGSESLSDVLDKIDALLIDKTRIEWESFIEIKFDGKAYALLDEDIPIRTYSSVEFGEMDMNMKLYMILIGKDERGQYWKKNPGESDDHMHKTDRFEGFKPDKYDWIKSGMGGAPKDPDRVEKEMTAIIADTPENRAALRNLLAMFEKLRIALFEIIDPKVIQKTLTRALNSSRLLAGIAEESDIKE